MGVVSVVTRPRPHPPALEATGRGQRGQQGERGHGGEAVTGGRGHAAAAAGAPDGQWRGDSDVRGRVQEVTGDTNGDNVLALRLLEDIARLHGDILC